MSDRRNLGFTLIELLVTVVVALAVMALASEVWIYSVRLMGRAGESLHEPALGSAAAQLRRDVHEAAGIDEPLASWTRGPLTLTGFDGSRIRFQLEQTALVRISEDADGGIVGRRLLAHPISSWRWRAVNPRLLDVEVEIVTHPDPVAAAVTDSQQESTPPLTTTRRLRIALRGGGGSW